MHESATTEPMLLPTSIREATGRFLNWVYNDVFYSDDGVLHLAVGDFTALPGFGAYLRVFYEWIHVDGGSQLTLGVVGADHQKVTRWADTQELPPFSLLMRCWVDLCHNMGVLSEGDWVDMDDAIDRAREAERPIYGDCWG